MKTAIGTLCLLLIASISPAVIAADSETGARTVTGIVTQVRATSRVLRVMDNRTRQRNNYTIPPDARIIIEGRERSLRNIERGQSVTLRYRNTDTGRVVESVRVPEPAVIAEVPPEPAPIASATPSKLPKTAGPTGLLLVLGSLFAGAAAAIGAVRRRTRVQA